MLIAKVSLIASSIASLNVRTVWSKNSTSCTGIPEFIDVMPEFPGTVCQTNDPPSGPCTCNSFECQKESVCVSNSIGSKAGMSFGPQKYVTVSYFTDKACSNQVSSQFFLADTCIMSSNGTSTFATSSTGEVRVYSTDGCKGSPGRTLATTTCTNTNQLSIRSFSMDAPVNSTGTSSSTSTPSSTSTSTTKSPSLSASIQSSLLSVSAMFTAALLFTAFS